MTRTIGWDSEWDHDEYYMAVAALDSGGHRTFWNRADAKAYLEGETALTVVAHNGLADWEALGYYPNHLDVVDSMTLIWLMDENGLHGLKHCTLRYLGRKLEDPITVVDDVVLFFGTPIAAANQADVERYCAEDSRAGMDLAAHALARLPKSVLRWYRDVEQPLDYALWKMYRRGIALDVEALAAEVALLAAEVPILEKAVFAATGYEFQHTSTLELRQVLYSKEWNRERDHRGLVGYLKTCEHGKTLDKCKVEGCSGLRPKYGWRSQTYPGQGLTPRVTTPGGADSTSEEALLFHAGNPVVDAILDFRESVKIQQFLASWSTHLRDGRLYPRLASAGTVTGRFSCRSPNLQQVPRRGELGKRMRRLFIPSPGNVLVVCDQDSIEARLLCSFARETVELERFSAGVDVHQALADDLGVTRDAAKTLRYALLYGAGPRRIAATLTRYGFRTTEAQAKTLVRKFYDALPAVRQWQERVEAAAVRSNQVQTVGGRTRHLTGTWSNDNRERQRALRQAGNSVVQGSAADVTKLWLVELDGLGVPMVLTVHDEVLADCPPDDAGWVGDAMEQRLSAAAVALGIRCPVTGTAHAVSTWGDK